MKGLMNSMKQVNLYRVSMIHRKSGEKVSLEVWAEDADRATAKCNFLFDYDGEYRWIGSGPLYKDSHLISKEVRRAYDEKV